MPQENPDHKTLKTKQRRLRRGFPDNLELRVHRGLSWLQRAEQAMAARDHDTAFIAHWIAFNALYAEDRADKSEKHERTAFLRYFKRIAKLDAQRRIHNIVWRKFPGSIRMLLENQYVFRPFWKHHNGVAGYGDWRRRFESDRRKFQKMLTESDVPGILDILFGRLYVLRNQLLHGGATWNGQVNRAQVRDSARIMALLIPVFIDLMMAHPEHPWGAPHYPVVEK